MTGSVSPGSAAGVEQPYPGTEVLDDMALLPRYHRVIERIVLRTIGHSEGQTVLDFGAGNGFMAERIQAAGHRVVCVEADAALRGRIGERGLEVYAGPGALPGESFNCIYSLNVFEHLEDDLDWVSRLWPLLRPGGYFVLYVPAFPLLYSSFDRAIGHVRRYTRRSGKDLFAPFAGSIQNCVYRDTAGFFVALLFRFLARKGSDRPGARALRFYDRWVVGVNRVLDPLLGRFLGKNLLMVVQKAHHSTGSCAPEKGGQKSTSPERRTP